MKQVKKVGRVARATCIMSHPIPDTNDSTLLRSFCRRSSPASKSDMYLFCCSYALNVAPKGKYIAFVSAEAETDNPQEELKPGILQLWPLDEIFYDIYYRYVPTNSSTADNSFTSTNYDPSTHFESTVKSVLETYTKITIKSLVLDLSVDLNAASATTEQ